MSINLSDLNDKLSNLGKSLDLEGPTSKLFDLSIKNKAGDLTEIGKIAGEVKGGFAGLAQNIDNPVEALAGQLDANGFPSGGVNTATINRIDESIQASIPALQTALTNNSSAIGALVSSAHGEAAAALAAAVPAALPSLDAGAGLMDDIIADGSPEALAATLKSVANVNPSDIKDLLSDVANIDVKGAIDDITSDILGLDLEKQFGDVLGFAEGKLGDVLGGLDGGNLLKAAIENFTGDIQTAITDVASNLGGINALPDLKSFTNLVIAGKGIDVANELVKGVKIPGLLEKELTAIGKMPAPFNKLSDLGGFVDGAKAFGLTDGARVEVAGLGNVLNKLDVDIANRDTSVSASVNPDNAVSTNPVVDPASYDGKFPFLNSQEEIVRYLQTASREITTVVWHWTAHYTNQGHIGSEQIDAGHRRRNPPFKEIGYHFIVKRDGSLQVGRNVNKTGAHVGGFNARSIGISFVAGYKCSSDKYNGTPPHSEVGVESITSAQHKTFETFMSAFYKVFPGGCAWGHVDFPRNSGKVDPGFDVAKRVYEMFGKKNVGHPKKDDKCLTVAEISGKRDFYGDEGGSAAVAGDATTTDTEAPADTGANDGEHIDGTKTPTSRSTNTVTKPDGTVETKKIESDKTVTTTTKDGNTETTETVNTSGGGSTTVSAPPSTARPPNKIDGLTAKNKMFRNESSARKQIARAGGDPRNFVITTTPGGRAKVTRRGQ